MISVECSKQIVEEATNWYFFGRTRGVFERFKQGLCTLGVLDAIHKFPKAFYPALCYTEKTLTWQEMDKMFTISLEYQGSNKRQLQTKIIGWWRDYLIDVQDGDGDISLGQILAFATGTDYPPALGWTTKPSIEFIYSKDLFPTANTCANILRLPTVHNVYEDFKCNLDFAIQNSPGFGQT
ncbi:G2/M phase-specific E3 ubiquitin-protein ligase-like [Polypterus senegalus]|uniref:G2/M phase-specific E3 ubiquitin-protein ligase-like n=1 Tax=Polypterus senegalus TaxID=55291 RepID=UPI001963A5B6|nr:G2/M phase-specific E3 ubiquitin-protein ligase-like [Polypterus senegalus]